MLSKTSRPVLDLKWGTATDHTFVLENLNGGLVLSQVATSLLTGKNSDTNGENEDEEEKKELSSSGKDFGLNEANLQKMNMEILKAISDSKDNKPLDFYKVSPDISKISKGKIKLTSFGW